MKKSEEHYKDGKRDGLSTYWYNNGKKLGSGHYKDGLKDGRWTWWYKSEMKKSE